MITFTLLSQGLRDLETRVIWNVIPIMKKSLKATEERIRDSNISNIKQQLIFEFEVAVLQRGFSIAKDFETSDWTKITGRYGWEWFQEWNVCQNMKKNFSRLIRPRNPIPSFVKITKNPYIIERIIILLVGESDENESCRTFWNAVRKINAVWGSFMIPPSAGRRNQLGKGLADGDWRIWKTAPVSRSIG